MNASFLNLYRHLYSFWQYRTKKPRWSAQTPIQETVLELDSALNAWLGDLPDHLRWDSNAPDSLFKRQSMQLHATYYHVQIYVRRPFIPTHNVSSSLSYLSLTICTNAARQCIKLGQNLLLQPLWAHLEDIHVCIMAVPIHFY